MCRYTLDALQLSVNDAALRRVHRLKHVLTLVTENLIRCLMRHVDQNFFSMLSVTADVQDHAESLFAVTVGHEVCKISDRIQSLTVTADCRAAVLTVNCDMDHIFLTIRIELAVDADTGEDLCYKRYCRIFCLTGLITLERLIIAVVYITIIFLVGNLSGNADSDFFLTQSQEALTLVEYFYLSLILLNTEFGQSKFNCFLFRLSGLGNCLFHA